MRTELEPALPRILGDRVQLQQVIINLAMNGMEAMRQILKDKPSTKVLIFTEFAETARYLKAQLDAADVSGVEPCEPGSRDDRDADGPHELRSL